jgi:hypothetical protein
MSCSSSCVTASSLLTWVKARTDLDACCGWLGHPRHSRAGGCTASAAYLGVSADEAADGILVNPIYPPEYRDFILVFPANSGVRPVYIVLNVPNDFKYHPAPASLPAFPDAKPAPLKTSVRGGGKKRRRWKDASGKIYEWDSQHGKVEMYTKQGKHLGEYDPKTGKQTKTADSTRRVEK